MLVRCWSALLEVFSSLEFLLHEKLSSVGIPTLTTCTFFVMLWTTATTVKMTANAARTAIARIAIATSENKAGPWTLMILGRRGPEESWSWDLRLSSVLVFIHTKALFVCLFGEVEFSITLMHLEFFLKRYVMFVVANRRQSKLVGTQIIVCEIWGAWLIHRPWIPCFLNASLWLQRIAVFYCLCNYVDVEEVEKNKNKT